MSKAWSGPEIEFLTRRLGESALEVYKVFCAEFEGRSYDSVQKKLSRLRDAISNVQNETSVEEVFEEVIADPFVAGYVGKKPSAQSSEDWLQHLLERTKQYKSSKPKHIPQVSDKASLVLVLSDLHFGKMTDVFNMEIARKRLLAIPAALQAQQLDVDEIVVVLLGDMVEGEDIYSTQNGVVECSVFEQTQTCAEAVWQMLVDLHETFKCTIRVETAPGNHGRMSRTANERSNWDNVVYYVLDVIDNVSGTPWLTMNANYRQFNTFEVKGHRIGIYHEGVKHASTPAMREKIAGWMIAKELDIFAHGHWHEWHIGNWLGKIVVANGSLCGADDLSEKMGKEDNARQAWFLLKNDSPPWCFSFLEWPN